MYPDGITYCPSKKKRDYIILFDAKGRSDLTGYIPERFSMNGCFRSMFEWHLHAESIGEIFFVVVSSDFAKTPKSIPDATLVYLPAESLALLATLKIMNEVADHHSFKRLLLGGETITKKVIDAWGRDYGLGDLEDEFPAKE